MAVLKPFQLGIIKDILGGYEYDQPFSQYFSNLARQHRNWGSKDRKTYKNACYAYFRLGFATGGRQPQLEEIQAALQPAEILLETYNTVAIFPHREWISSLLDAEKWTGSLLQQRPVYLALRKGCQGKVIAFLKDQGISYTLVNELCIQVPAGSKCDEIVEKGWAWVMDIASQETASRVTVQANDQVWDCCSGAGGKALYLSNRYGDDLQLTCSDRRFSILENLKQRFLKTGLKLPHIELSDLNEPFQLRTKYDTIILDVPCSGSGTWGRTPENILMSDEQKISSYSALQKTIVKNALRNLKPGGRLYYMTCSVFHAENEDNVQHFVQSHELEQVSSEYIFSDYNSSDVLFLAVLQSKA